MMQYTSDTFITYAHIISLRHRETKQCVLLYNYNNTGQYVAHTHEEKIYITISINSGCA